MKALVYCITASLAIEYFDRNGKIEDTDFRAQIPDYDSVSFFLEIGIGLVALRVIVQ